MENNRTNLLTLKESLKNAIREKAQIVCDFEDEVNAITFVKAGCGRITATGDYVADMMMGDICDRIINSKMSMADKEYILSTMSGLIRITKVGTELSLMSDEERQQAVEEVAEDYIKNNKHIAEKFNSKKMQSNK